VKSFESTVGNDCKGSQVEPYPADPDYYFRPWKVYREIDVIVKENRSSPEWRDKVAENRELLEHLYSRLQMKASMKAHPELVLWSLTHIFTLLMCEESYISEDSSEQRVALQTLTPPDVRAEIKSLACWVWNQRFFASGFQVSLGGWIFLDLIQVRL
jgi:hypothetical protein